EKKTLHDIHWLAWKKGVKSLYYCRSKSVQRADVVSRKTEVYDHGAAVGAAPGPEPLPLAASGDTETDYEECLACQ
ncbi:MAG: ribonucleotide-diphosphate reductase subunit alpha, partial [Alphaproteobacteria bacterium]